MSLKADVMRIGRRVRDARKLAGLSQTELAHMVGYSAANPISKLENGRIASVDVLLLDKIALATRVPIEFLTGAEPTPGDDTAIWPMLLASHSRQIHLLEQVLEKVTRLADNVGAARKRRAG